MPVERSHLEVLPTTRFIDTIVRVVKQSVLDSNSAVLDEYSSPWSDI